MTIPLLLAIILSLVAIAFVLYPLLSPTLRRSGETTRWSAEGGPGARRSQLYREIADLDFDFQTGKVAPTDYQLLREDLLRRAAELLREQDREEHALDEGIEAEVAAIRRARAGRRAVTCAKCGRRFQSDDEFCARCGASRSDPATPQPAGRPEGTGQ